MPKVHLNTPVRNVVDSRNVSEDEEIPFLLPEDFKVYTNGKTVINHPYPGFTEKTLPTYNDYMGEDGGYVAIYTHDKKQGIYSVGGGIYVSGQIRVPGSYEGRTFIPAWREDGDNITRDARILEACSEYCDMEGKWLGGDTGGWFGIP